MDKFGLLDMMEIIKWFFDGIGTQLLSMLVSGIVGYKIGIRKTIKQYQNAKDLSKQVQVNDKIMKNGTNSVTQIQKAGRSAKQFQKG